MEAMGVKVKEQFAVLGLYDFVTLIEPQDNLTIMTPSAEIGSRGSVQILTLPAIPIEELVKKLK